MKYLALAFMCISVNVTASKRSSIKKVHKEKKRRPTECSICHKIYAKKSNAQRHVRSVHKQGEVYHCLSCDHATADTSNLKRHVRRLHPGTIYLYYKGKRQPGQKKRKKRASTSSLQQPAKLDKTTVAATLLNLSVPIAPIQISNNNTSSTPTHDLNLSPVATPTSPLKFNSPIALSTSVIEWPVDNFQVKQEQ